MPPRKQAKEIPVESSSIIPSDDTAGVLQISIPMMKGESMKAYRALLDFCLLGLSLQELLIHYAKAQAAGQPVPTKEKRDLNTWYSKFNWFNRRQQYELQRSAEMERELQESSELSRTKLNDTKLRIIDRANQMLDYPIEEQTVTETLVITPDMVGTRIDLVTVVKPSEWTFGTVGSLMTTALALDKNAQFDIRAVITQLKKKGYIVTAPDGSPVTTAADILDTQD